MSLELMALGISQGSRLASLGADKDLLRHSALWPGGGDEGQHVDEPWVKRRPYFQQRFSISLSARAEERPWCALCRTHHRT